MDQINEVKRCGLKADAIFVVKKHVNCILGLKNLSAANIVILRRDQTSSSIAN
jgi:hypothetical protein